VTPGNTLYRFEMSVEEPMADDLRLLLFILDFWQTYGFHVGGRTTTGLGEARLEDLKFFGLDFSNPAVLRDYLLRGDPKVAEEYLPPAAEITFVKLKEMAGRLTAAPESVADTDAFLPQHLFLTIALEPLDPLLVGGNVPKLPPEAGEARVSDTEFVTALRAEDGEVLYIPGSALKGVFRTRAEKIIRTLNFYRGYPTAEDAHSNIEAAEQAYQERICACAVTHARKETEEEPERLWACFGTRKEQRKAAGADGRAVYEASCLTCRLFGNTMMRGRIAFSDASLMEEMEARLKLFDHVAIDRFTGGAAEAKKFDTRPLLPGDGPLFTFGIHLERFEPWMVGLLAYLLKDLHTGDIRLGRATHRGYGRIRGQVTQAELLVLQGSELYQICESAGLDLGEEFGPYHKVILDLPTLFGPKQWPEEGPDTVSPTARFLQACDEVFQAIVREEEGKEHGEVQGE
jgi:CRISPR/Cas system CSM-associated protein Csm3 (group 7 of RAMP superfamily)